MELLAKGLVKYIDHLSSKRIQISAVHASSEPARVVANALTVQYVSAHHLVPSELSEISAAVSVLLVLMCLWILTDLGITATNMTMSGFEVWALLSCCSSHLPPWK